MGMDVIWTAEFAEAKWIKAWPERFARQLRAGTLKGPLATATYKGRVYAAPANTNTQLLWYRKDLVKNPADTWEGLIKQAINKKERRSNRNIEPMSEAQLEYVYMATQGS